MRERPGTYCRHRAEVAARTALIAACILMRAAALPGAESPSEYQVKAAFLLNFTRFVEWPPTAFADATSPFNICILGEDPFGPALDQIVSGEKVNDHPIVVRRLHGGDGIKGCHVLFVAEPDPIARTVLAGMGRGVLTVGDGDRFVQAGGAIGFVMEHRRVRFDINQSAAANASLKLSSRLLSVARTVAN